MSKDERYYFYDKETDPEGHVLNNQILELVMKNLSLLKSNRIEADRSIPDNVRRSVEAAYEDISNYISGIKKSMNNR